MSKLAVNANTLWLYAVLVHIAGSIVVNVMTALPFGSVILMTGIWAGLFLALNKNRKYMIPLGAGWVLSIFILFNIPPSYEGSFLLNGFIVVLVFYVCQSRETDPVEFCHIKKIPVKQWGLIFLLSIGLIIIAGYVNGISMLAFYNVTVNSLQEVGKYFPESLIVLALVPALSEEMLFRGCIYQEISGMDKKGKAVFLSAILFALLHMNFNQMSYAFVMGLFFGFLVLVTDNLSVSMLIHAIFNCFNVFIYAFPDHFMIKAIMNIHVGSYYLFNPVLRDGTGAILQDALIVGAIITLCMLIFVGALLYILSKWSRQEHIETGNIGKKQKIEENTLSLWKPDREFWAGCILCLAYAGLYELFMHG